MTEKYYSMEFLKKVQKWEEAYKKWSRELNTVDTQMQQYILVVFGKEETRCARDDRGNHCTTPRFINEAYAYR